jgi:hypothetical protein
LAASPRDRRRGGLTEILAIASHLLKTPVWTFW